MKLSKNSWHARINTYVFGSSYIDKVDCLCPYFWKTIIALLVSPLVFIINRVEDLGIEVPSISTDMQNRIGRIIMWTAFGAIIIGLFVFAILNWEKFIIVMAVIGIVIVSVTGFMYGSIWIKNKWEDWRYDHPKEKRERRPNLMVEFIRAKKNKHCPLITWE